MPYPTDARHAADERATAAVLADAATKYRSQRMEITRIAQDALRKIRLGHPCDVPELIAAYALEEIEGVLAS